MVGCFDPISEHRARSSLSRLIAAQCSVDAANTRREMDILPLGVPTRESPKEGVSVHIDAPLDGAALVQLLEELGCRLPQEGER